MFEFIRNHKRWMQLLLALLIVPSFIVVGVSSYGGGGTGSTEVANVGGRKVTQQEWEEAQRQQMERYRGMMGEQFDQRMFETPQAKQAILENLVAERALDAEIAKSHISIGEAALQKQIGDIQAFKKPDGSFDMERYKTMLAAQGMTPEMFDARMRRDLALQQLNNAIQATAFAPRSVAARLSEISDQEREVQELLFPAAQFLPHVKVSDEMVKAYYEKNPALFQIPEQAKVEYVLFDAAVVEKQVSVADAEVSEFYAKNQKRFATGEQRNASHILITAGKDASAADKAAAKAKAEAILAEVRKAPASFAAVAKAQSQDPSSAELGGDLGQVEKNALPAAVESTVYQLKQGQISDVVASEFGFHIVTVTRVAPASVKTLDEVKGDIIAELKKQKMSKKYSELAELFTNTVYEQSDSLKPVADKLQLTIQTVDNLARTPSPAMGAVPVNNAKFLQAIFADDALKNKRNTEAIEVAPSTLVAGRVVAYTPAARRPLANVDAVIRQRVAQEEAAKLAKQAGEAKLAAARASADAAGFGEAKIVTRTQQAPIHQAGATEVLKADVSKLPVYVGVDVPGVGYGVYRIAKVSQPAKPDLARRAAEQQQITSSIAQQEMYGYVEALKAKAKAKVLVKPADMAAADVR